VRIAKTEAEEIQIDLPVDGIFNSHIAVFGNTGSGKSNTVAALYQGLFDTCGENQGFLRNCRFLIFDFNGEYTKEGCITPKKRIYNLTTQDESGDKIPLTSAELFDNETLSVLVEATEKTQKPFLGRALRLYWNVKETDYPASYLRAIVQNKTRDILNMTNKDVAFKLLDLLEEILESFVDETTIQELRRDIEFHNQSNAFFVAGTGKGGSSYTFFNSEPEAFRETNLYRAAENINAEGLDELSDLTQFYILLHLQLIEDLYKYKVQNDHIYPVINRFRSKQRSIERTFKVEDTIAFWGENNCVVINLQNVNLDMRKTIPLLLAKNIYNAHKNEQNDKSLNIIVDEAHNILSKTSFRETEDWKDYRLETFEEIIKEGRKFGVFLTISSQRPNDISETIISQAHNYFIHQLINQRDLVTIGSAVSYIDKITEESIPTLPVGTCIFSGIATPMPLKLKITELPEHQKPDSHTLQFKNLLSDGRDEP
jgi:DNA helicase HerA-like ATPase